MQPIKARFQILGAKGFKGDVDGTHYDSTKLYVLMDVSDKNGTEVGFNATPLSFGKSDEFEKIRHMTFPLHADLSLKLTTKGYEVVDFAPVKAA